MPHPQNGCFHNTLQQQSPDVQRSNPRWVLKTVEPNLPNETCPTSLNLLQPAQCPIEMWEIFMPHPVQTHYILYLDFETLKLLRKMRLN
jgi:hypothetical protein